MRRDCRISKEKKIAVIKDIQVKIPKELVLSRLKFAKYKTRADKKVLNLISEVIKEGYGLIVPAAVYEIFEINILGQEIKFKGSKFAIKSRTLAKHLKGFSKAALFVCTIGKKLADKVNNYVKYGEIARATILDAVGSEAAEALAEKIEALIKIKASKEGYSVVRRFSPGYSDWTIFDQPKILRLLKACKIGVKATKSCILIPEKSVTACIGLHRKPQTANRKP